ncbi:MAG TPA: hypothetical protein VJT74_00305 [Pyrinomonadaceae bacterium]|nr:hypothetical protein [Pyrinomonadaceae bacterium]
MRIPIIGTQLDERFLNHRLRSTSLAGVAGGVVAMGLFAYRYYHDHFWSWDLLVVGVTIVVVKWVVLAWYRLKN